MNHICVENVWLVKKRHMIHEFQSGVVLIAPVSSTSQDKSAHIVGTKVVPRDSRP